MASQYPAWQGEYPTWQAPLQGAALPWAPGAGTIDPAWATGPGQQYLGQPEALWSQGRLAQMSQAQLANPAWTRQGATGFTPLWGEYMLGGGVGGEGFGAWLGHRTTPSVTQSPFGSPPMDVGGGNAWSRAVEASRALMKPGAETSFANPAASFALQDWMQGENARRNAIAMTQAQLGGGVGAGAMARQRTLGRMYDIYAARQAGTGDPEGGFIDWISRRISPGILPRAYAIPPEEGQTES